VWRGKLEACGTFLELAEHGFRDREGLVEEGAEGSNCVAEGDAIAGEYFECERSFGDVAGADKNVRCIQSGDDVKKRGVVRQSG
jgi:hypothetical protein